MESNQDKAFRNLQWSGKQTTEEVYESCSFESCDLSDSVFSFCKFIDCIFTNCNLSMVKLTDCLLNDIKFINCKLLGINFSDCNDSLFTLKFNGCLLDYCSFVKKKMVKTRFINSSVKNVDFSECDLTKSSFSDSDLMNSVFYRTILREADFLSASNYVIDPELSNIRKAKFSLVGIPGLLIKYNITIE
jgi:fluoroquinolone resistance protein